MTHTAALGAPLTRIGWRTALLASLLYVAFLIISAPAAALVWAITAATGRVVSLERAQGRIWNGQGTLVVADQSRVFHRVTQLRWDWLPARMMAGELALRIEVEDPRLHGGARVAYSREGAHASDGAFHIETSVLAEYVPQLIPAGLTGDLSIRTEEFALRNDGYSGVATIEMRNVASVHSSVHPLGEYRALVVGAGEQVEFRVDTLNGALLVEGRGTWSRGSGLNFAGSARAASTHKTALTPLLRFFGPDLGGEHPIRVSGLYQLAL